MSARAVQRCCLRIVSRHSISAGHHRQAFWAGFVALAGLIFAWEGRAAHAQDPSASTGADFASLKAAADASMTLVSLEENPLGSVAADGHVHGVRIGRACAAARCASETIDCITVLKNADGYGDAIEVVQAWDLIDPLGLAIRVPDFGNLQIAAAAGNTTCQAGGMLPCLVCAGGATCGGAAAVSSLPGEATFRQNSYVIHPSDPELLISLGNVLVRDMCDTHAADCSRLLNPLQFAAGTQVGLCCGNGVTEALETCDGSDAGGCQRPCRPPGDPAECTCCGDGMVNGEEDCDDGNLVNNDGCNTKCFFACGDGAVNRPVETCDMDDAPSCNAPCRLAGTVDECTCCGDGMVQSGEQCDDGNGTDGDGCSTECLTETLFSGCSPDFWLQSAHLPLWPANYDPGDSVNDVFGINAAENPTLLKALSTEGDAECAFLREAVAALFNSVDPELNYYYTPTQVKALARVAYSGGRFDYCKALLAQQNDQGCPRSKSGRDSGMRPRRADFSGKTGR